MIFQIITFHNYALFYAVNSGNVEIVELLLKQTDINVKITKQKDTLLNIAIRNKIPEICKSLLDHPDTDASEYSIGI